MIVSGSNTAMKEFKLPPVGNHLARLYRVIDLGTQMREFEGKVNMQRRVKFFWELHGEDETGAALTTDDGKPLIQSHEYTWSLGEKANLRRDLESWRGVGFTDEEVRGFDIRNVLGQFCMLNIVHRESLGKKYANVKGVSKVPAIFKKAGLPLGVNDPMIFNLENFNRTMFESLSTNLQDTIKKSAEFRALDQPTTSAQYVAASGGSIADLDDDVPF
jgi:hypothetical protein